MYIEFNNNPVGRNNVGDCAVRALSKALDISWETAYLMLATNGLQMGNVLNANEVISATLRQNGFRRANIPNMCPDCFSVKEFAEMNPTGTYVLGTGTHVVTVDGGDYYDSWNSGDEVPVYVWYEKLQPRFE